MPSVKILGVIIINTSSTILSFNIRGRLFCSLVRRTLDIGNVQKVIIHKAIGFCVITLSRL